MICVPNLTNQVLSGFGRKKRKGSRAEISKSLKVLAKRW
jgi:hypothetical protein